MMRKKQHWMLALILAACVILPACSVSEPFESVIIASKQFTENLLLSEMYAQLIESRTELGVIRKQNMGTTAVCFPSMESEAVDIYVEYTGTIYKEILQRDDDPDIPSHELYEMIRQEMEDTKGITVYRSIGLNNTYALAMLDIKAAAFQIRSMSDLSVAAPELVFAANDLYYMRANDGYDTMVQKYGMRFKSAVKMSNSLLYDAVSNDQVDVIVVYATDSLLPKYDMVILEDDLRMFPDYYAVPMVRTKVLEQYPELTGVLDLLADRIDNTRMQELNYKVDIEGIQPQEVAASFLTELGLLDG